MNLSEMSGEGWGWRAEGVISLEDKKEIQRKKEKREGWRMEHRLEKQEELTEKYYASYVAEKPLQRVYYLYIGGK